MAYENPSIQDFKDLFFRDFPYGVNPEENVLDQDIANAFRQTNVTINQGYFPDQDTYTLYYLYLSAHFLVLSLITSSLGVLGSGFNYAESSKSVGSVSQSFSIPQKFLDNPVLGSYMQTRYGSMYLQYLLPQLNGQIFIAYGRTQA